MSWPSASRASAERAKRRWRTEGVRPGKPGERRQRCAPPRGSLRGGREPGDAADQRPDTVPRNGSVAARRPATMQHRSEAVGTSTARRVGATGYITVSASAACCAACRYRSRKESRANPVSNGHQSRQTDHPHGHEGQVEREAWTTSRSGRRARRTRVPACRVVNAPPTVEFMETTGGLGILP